MPTEFHIIFNGNPEGIVYCGEELSGRVDITTDTPQNIQGIHLILDGYSKVTWSGEAYYHEDKGIKQGNFSGRIQHLTNKIQLFNNAEHADFSPGHYTYPFQFIIPHNLPTSYQDKYGKIQYDLIIAIHRTDDTKEIYKKGLTLIKPLELHLHPSCLEPLQIDNELNVTCDCCLCFCCFPRGFILGTLKTPATGYLSGQNVPFTAIIKNQTTHNAEVTVKLLSKVKYSCNEPFDQILEHEHDIIFKNLGIAEASKMVELGDSIEIPSLAPSSLNTSPLINVTYLLVLSAKVPNSPILRIDIPLIIGTSYEEKRTDSRCLVYKPKEKTRNQNIQSSNMNGDVSVICDTNFSTCNEAFQTTEENDDASIWYKVSTFEPLYPVIQEEAL